MTPGSECYRKCYRKKGLQEVNECCVHLAHGIKIELKITLLSDHAPHPPLITSSAAEVETVAVPDTSSSPTALLQVGPGGPHCGIVGHVVVGGEQLDLGPRGRGQRSCVCMCVCMHACYLYTCICMHIRMHVCTLCILYALLRKGRGKRVNLSTLHSR